MSVETELMSGALQPRMTVDGLRNLIQDLRRSPHGAPALILVSEYDRREINQDLMAGSVVEVAKEDQNPLHDGFAIGVIEGVMISSHSAIARGKCRCCYPIPEKQPIRLGGEGKIIVGA